MSDKTCISPLATRPVLYTDTVGGKQTCRDDLWAVTTDELNALHRQAAPEAPGSEFLSVEEAYAQSSHRHHMDIGNFKALCAARGWKWRRPAATVDAQADTQQAGAFCDPTKKHCTREAGHDGRCAAIPAATTASASSLASAAACAAIAQSEAPAPIYQWRQKPVGSHKPAWHDAEDADDAKFSAGTSGEFRVVYTAPIAAPEAPTDWLKDELSMVNARSESDLIRAGWFLYEGGEWVATSSDDPRATILYRKSGRAPAQQTERMQPSREAADSFADWLKREMPPGTVISDPAWWAPRVLRAAQAAHAGADK